MTDINTKLVAIEEETLETVAGGWGGYKPVKLDLDLFSFDFDLQKNESVIAGNQIVAGRDAVIAVTQSNS